MKFVDSPKENAGQGTTSPFGGKEARSQRDQMNGDAQALTGGKGASVMESANDTNFGYTSKKGKSFSK